MPSSRKRQRPSPPAIHGPVVDSHCHLEAEAYGGEAGVAQVIRGAREAGLVHLVAIGSGYGLESAGAAVALARRHPGFVSATVGLHPHHARLGSGEAWARLAEVAREPEVVAWGEVGLDFHYDLSPHDVQREALRIQVGLARARSLPLVIHDRESGGETFRILLEEGAFEGAGVLFHCYSGTLREAEPLLEAGAFLSVPGVVTFPKATALHEVAAGVPLERLLVETDAPFLTPAPWRGKRNEPAHVRYTVARIAELRGISPTEVAWATTRNAWRFYGLPGEPG